jgi:N-acetylmuramoyl-L-alanine amidase
MLKRLFAITTLLALLCPAVAFGGNAERDYQKARDAYYALQNSARKQMYREQWVRVCDGFEKVHERYPGSRRGADALFMCGKTTAGLYNVSRIKPDAEEAVRLFVRMADSYPDSSLADDALLRAATLLEEVLGDKTRAYRLYDRVVRTLGKGDMADKARRGIKRLARFAPPAAAESAPPAQSNDAKKIPTGTVSGNVGRSAVGAGRLTAIRYWSNPGYTRIVLDVSGEARFEAHYLAADPAKGDPPRLYVDIDRTALDEALSEPTIVDDGLLRRIRTGQPQSGTVRVVLDLVSIGDYKVFPLGDPWRIVIDIAADKQVELKRDEVVISALPGTGDAISRVLKDAPQAVPPVHIPKAPAKASLRRIVVDAGHGGKDPGAVGPSGLLEKTVTLNMVKELAAELRRQIGCEVVLTRSGDVYLPLEERTAIANKVGADLFISLHANANRNRKAYGIETYYLNFSKNDKAAAVAARENGTSLKQVSDLELILFDLMANAKINESSRLASTIQEALVKGIDKGYGKVRDLGVRQGPFYVLLGATMPSVLVETAFISNPREEKRLASKSYRKTAAEAIAAAVKDYAVSNKLLASR